LKQETAYILDDTSSLAYDCICLYLILIMKQRTLCWNFILRT